MSLPTSRESTVSDKWVGVSLAGLGLATVLGVISSPPPLSSRVSPAHLPFDAKVLHAVPTNSAPTGIYIAHPSTVKAK
jgi:hypothetical protein